jgi:stage III sporulation protein AG
MVKEYFEKLKNFGIGKILLIMLAGVLLLLSGSTESEKSDAGADSVNSVKSTGSQNSTSQNDMEDRLKLIISKMGGVSEVNVMVTFEDDGEEILVYGENISKNVTKQDGVDGSNSEAESLTTTQEYLYENETPYAVKKIAPKVCGVVVVYYGDKELIDDIAQAVKVLTDVEYNRIKVLSVN